MSLLGLAKRPRSVAIGGLVIGVLGIAFFSFSLYQGYQSVKWSRGFETRTKLESLKQALEYYADSCGELPVRLSDLLRNERDVSGWRGPYADSEALVDGWALNFGTSLRAREAASPKCRATVLTK